MKLFVVFPPSLCWVPMLEPKLQSIEVVYAQHTVIVVIIKTNCKIIIYSKNKRSLPMVSKVNRLPPTIFTSFKLWVSWYVKRLRFIHPQNATLYMESFNFDNATSNFIFQTTVSSFHKLLMNNLDWFGNC